MHTDEAKQKKKPGPKPKQNQKRVYKGDIKVHHDLYKLELARFKKNIALPEEIPDYRDVEHCHFFHTVDSSGKKQEFCSPVGGHFHKIEFEQNTDGPPKVKSVSGPLRFVRRKIRGRWVKQIEEIVEYNNNGDIVTHSHEVEYLRSDDVALRQTNMDATSAITQVAQRTAPMPGVIG